jgi:hypothetical protein
MGVSPSEMSAIIFQATRCCTQKAVIPVLGVLIVVSVVAVAPIVVTVEVVVED